MRGVLDAIVCQCDRTRRTQIRRQRRMHGGRLADAERDAGERVRVKSDLAFSI